MRQPAIAVLLAALVACSSPAPSPSSTDVKSGSLPIAVLRVSDAGVSVVLIDPFEGTEETIIEALPADPIRLASDCAGSSDLEWSSSRETLLAAVPAGCASSRISFISQGGDGSWIAESITDGFDPAWAPGGTRFAYVPAEPEATCFGRCEQGRIVVRDLASGTEEVVFADPDASYLGASAWSPDGTALAFVRGRGIYVQPLGGEAEFLALGTDPCWTADGANIAYSRWDGSADTLEQHVLARAAFGGPVRQRAEVDIGRGASAACSPVDRRIAHLFLRSSQETGIAVSEGIGQESEVVIDDTVGQFDAWADRVAWSPDGAWVAFTVRRGDVSRVLVSRPDGSELRDVGEGSWPAWAPR